MLILAKISKINYKFMNTVSLEQRYNRIYLTQERYNIPNIYLPNTNTWVAEINGT